MHDPQPEKVTAQKLIFLFTRYHCEKLELTGFVRRYYVQLII